MDSSESSLEGQGIYAIKDTRKILFVMGVAAACVVLNFYMDLGAVNSLTNNLGEFDSVGSFFMQLLTFPIDLIRVILVTGILALLTVIPATYRLLALWDGVRIDLNARTIEFPGGGVAANEVTDYLKPKFLLQFFSRSTVNIDTISQMSKKTKTWSRKRWDKLQKTWIHSETQKYYVECVGTHGAFSIAFDTEGKCEELMSAIRQINRMGTPIFDA